MKKQLFIIFVSGLLFSCSSDDDSLEECSSEVWGMSKTCDGSDCNYSITYGSTEVNTTTITINKATYDFYDAIVQDEDNRDCWEGLK